MIKGLLRKYNNYKHICTQQGNTSIYKTNTSHKGEITSNTVIMGSGNTLISHQWSDHPERKSKGNTDSK